MKFAEIVSPEISNLSLAVLNSSDLGETDYLLKHLLGSKESQNWAIEFLQNKIGTYPKRPIYYLNMHLRHLPDSTRDVIRYAGDYIDILMKDYALRYGNVLKRLFAQQSSLRTNLQNSKSTMPGELYEKLILYNRIIYTPAKHDFKVADAPHRFSLKEAITICYITMKLGQEITNLITLEETTE